MQVLLLSLIIGIFLHDAQVDMHERATRAAIEAPASTLVLLLLVPKLLVGGLFHGLCVIVRGRMSGPHAMRWVLWLDRLGMLARFALLGLYAMDLYLGALIWLRARIGQLVLVDELLFMTPTLLIIVWNWWAYYPVDRRLREASTISRLDRGLPIYPIWTRGQYIVAQLRHQFALILLPLILLVAWEELVAGIDGQWLIQRFGFDARFVLVLAGSGMIFLLAPVVIRHVWDTVPLPEGAVRKRLLEMCREHRVGVRELLIWRTFGGMINGAVMGLLPRLRYIMLTDALLETVPTREVEAVMAHELAHVRKHHIPWMLVIAAGFFAFASMVLISAAIVFDHGAVGALFDERGNATLEQAPVLIGLATVLSAVVWFLGFGWVSRRFERQADTFAVQHMARLRTQPETDEPQRIDEEAAEAMVSALQYVAELNHIPTRRRSWRHGSIQWRQDYLRTLVGRPIDRLAVDRQVFWIKTIGGLLFLGVVSLQLLAGFADAAG